MNRDERIAQITAHRACCGGEHNPSEGKIHGFCVVCGVPWPCEYAGSLPKKSIMISEEQREMAIEAIDDAIENRKIAGHPHDKGLDLAKAIANSEIR